MVKRRKIKKSKDSPAEKRIKEKDGEKIDRLQSWPPKSYFMVNYVVAGEVAIARGRLAGALKVSLNRNSDETDESDASSFSSSNSAIKKSVKYVFRSCHLFLKYPVGGSSDSILHVFSLMYLLSSVEKFYRGFVVASFMCYSRMKVVVLQPCGVSLKTNKSLSFLISLLLLGHGRLQYRDYLKSKFELKKFLGDVLVTNVTSYFQNLFPTKL